MCCCVMWSVSSNGKYDINWTFDFSFLHSLCKTYFFLHCCLLWHMFSHKTKQNKSFFMLMLAADGVKTLVFYLFMSPYPFVFFLVLAGCSILRRVCTERYNRCSHTHNSCYQFASNYILIEAGVWEQCRFLQ